MTARTNQRIILASRPHGKPQRENFKFVASEIPPLEDGQILLQTLWLSLDPYMRAHMDEGVSYAPRVQLGEVMKADTVNRVVESKHPGFKVGEIVDGYTHWQTFSVSDGAGLHRVDPAIAPISTALGVLGMPGLTAYTGLLNIGKPRPGETLAVAAATGPVGSLVGQIGKMQGCRVIGIAGSSEKCQFLTDDLGFDAGLNHRATDFKEKLAAACPDGIDIYFENVGGHVWHAVFPLLNDFARIPVCGLIAHYNDVGLPPGPDHLPEVMEAVLVKRLTIRGFIVTDFEDQIDDFRRDVSSWLRTGAIKYKEDVIEGLENAPSAFIGLLKGRNFGKLLVKVSE
jgi:NADPH-dependent curcumin reductase